MARYLPNGNTIGEDEAILSTTAECIENIQSENPVIYKISIFGRVKSNYLVAPSYKLVSINMKYSPLLILLLYSINIIGQNDTIHSKCFPFDKYELLRPLNYYDYFSDNLIAFNEKKMCEDTNNVELYRVTYIRSFHVPIVLILYPQTLIIKKGNKVRIDNSYYEPLLLDKEGQKFLNLYNKYKKLTYEPDRAFWRQELPKLNDKAYIDSLNKKMYVKDTIEFTYTITRIQLNKDDYERCKRFFNSEFSTELEMYFDGSHSLVESSINNKYKFGIMNFLVSGFSDILINFVCLKDKEIY